MRVTSKMMQNTYIKNVNVLTGGTRNSLNQLSSGMKLFRASENTAAAVKAYQTRTGLARNIGYKSNLSHAKSVLTSSESVLMGIQSSSIEAKGKIVQALNSTTNQQNRATIANELTSIADQIMEAMNSNDSGFYLFGGSNTEVKPFTKIGGQLAYNGHVLNELNVPEDQATIDELVNDSLYIDIGLGPEFNEDGSISKNTVLHYSLTGIDVLGYGTSPLIDGDGNQFFNDDDTPLIASNNIYDLINELAAEFRKSDEEYSVDRADALYGRFESLAEAFTTKLTDIGAKSTYIKHTENRIETLDFNLVEKQSDIEDVDYAESYITYSSLYTSYQAALKIGSQIIGPSLFDYLS